MTSSVCIALKADDIRRFILTLSAKTTLSLANGFDRQLCTHQCNRFPSLFIQVTNNYWVFSFLEFIAVGLGVIFLH